MERLRLVLAAAAAAALLAIVVLLVMIRGDLERLGDQVMHAGEAGERARLRDLGGDPGGHRGAPVPDPVSNEHETAAREFVNDVRSGEFR